MQRTSNKRFLLTWTSSISTHIFPLIEGRYSVSDPGQYAREMMELDPITLKRLNPLIAGIVFVALIPFMYKVFDMNLWLYRKWGWNKLADQWESKKDKWVRINQWICGVLAVVLLLAALFFPDEWAQYFRLP